MGCRVTDTCLRAQGPRHWTWRRGVTGSLHLPHRPGPAAATAEPEDTGQTHGRAASDVAGGGRTGVGGARGPGQHSGSERGGGAGEGWRLSILPLPDAHAVHKSHETPKAKAKTRFPAKTA